MGLLQRIGEAEMNLCLAFNRASLRPVPGRVFAVVSRLGDGVFWYVLMIALPVIHGWEAIWASLHMAVVGVVALPIYKWLKHTTVRSRPCDREVLIHRSVPALDQFSFPSGHTMHAVGFTIVLLAYYPEWALLVVPFTALVALSRLVLGLHYPSDVLAGAGIGATVAMVSLAL
ncbi:MAG: phosphatase PAP2 family protein [Halieaceae bacterium]|nr:phosphatase PAP2 family protein [Halieaceae bacterium]